MFRGIWVPDALLQSRDLSAGSKLCYAVLARHAGKSDYCWPARATIARALGLCPVSVRRHLRQLVRQGFLGRDSRPGHTARYYFLRHHLLVGDTQHPGPASPYTRGPRAPGPGAREPLREMSQRNESVKRGAAAKMGTDPYTEWVPPGKGN